MKRLGLVMLLLLAGSLLYAPSAESYLPLMKMCSGVNGSPLSGTATDFSTSVAFDETNKEYTRVYWGKLTCGVSSLPLFDTYTGTLPQGLTKGFLTGKRIALVDGNGVPIAATCRAASHDGYAFFCVEDKWVNTGFLGPGPVYKELMKLAYVSQKPVQYWVMNSNDPSEAYAAQFSDEQLLQNALDRIKTDQDTDKDGVYNPVDNCPDMANTDGSPFSQSLDDYMATVAMVDNGKQYVVNWWGKIACGAFENILDYGSWYLSGKYLPYGSMQQYWTQLQSSKVTLITVNLAQNPTVFTTPVSCAVAPKDKTIILCTENEAKDAQGKSRAEIVAEIKAAVESAKEVASLYAPVEYAGPKGMDYAKSWFERGEAQDVDQDGIIDSVDNCKDAPNFDQKDTDQNGVGDACEAAVPPPKAVDSDSDGVPDVDEEPACVGQGTAGNVDADGCPLDTNAPVPLAGQPGAASEGGGGPGCSLMPTAGPNAGMLMLLAAIVPLVIRRKP